VVVGRSEIEVRGTAFTVTASAEHLVGVAVSRGRVEVRPETGAPAAVVAGASWRGAVVSTAELASQSAPSRSHPALAPSGSPLALAPSDPSPAVPDPPRARPAPAPSAPHRAAITLSPRAGTPPPAPAPSPEPAPPRGEAEELSYDQAWEALRASDFARAARGFARVVLLAPDSPLAEDASFWRAVALARGKRGAEAVAAFRDFLDAYGPSARAGEASAMLGWLLVDARDYDEAGRRFRAAAGDPSPAVRTSARAGLDALARRDGRDRRP
jgi:TolA-binding protein